MFLTPLTYRHKRAPHQHFFFEREETVCVNERAESGTFGGWIDSKVHLNSSLSD